MIPAPGKAVGSGFQRGQFGAFGRAERAVHVLLLQALVARHFARGAFALGDLRQIGVV